MTHGTKESKNKTNKFDFRRQRNGANTQNTSNYFLSLWFDRLIISFYCGSCGRMISSTYFLLQRKKNNISMLIHSTAMYYTANF